MTRRSAAHDVFHFQSYKEYLRSLLLDPKGRGALSRAADAIGCQRSYLSRVLRTEPHLTLDQVFRLAKHFALSADEAEYFQLLVEIERAADFSYRQHLQSKADRIRKDRESLSHRIRRPSPASGHEPIYFSSWQWSAIHFLTSIPEYQRPEALAERMGMTRTRLMVFLERLESWGLVRQIGSRWVYAGGEFHLPKESTFVKQHHLNWRTQAVVNAQLPGDDELHFTTVQTLSRADLKKLKELLLKFISDANAMLGPSKPEDGIVLTCDLFRI